MKHKDYWKRVDMHCLSCVQDGTWPRDRSNLDGLRRRNVRQGVFNGVDLVALEERRMVSAALAALYHMETPSNLDIQTQ